MSSDSTFTNARIVTPGGVVLGTLVVAGGRILGVASGPGTAGQDLAGDLLIPGLIELHTDNLEKHYSPRMGVEWDGVAAAIAHDTQCAGSGITTVYDSLVVGAHAGWEMRDDWLRPMLAGLAAARRHGMLKVDHRLHLRLEVTHGQIVELFQSFRDEPALGLVSMMDHAPGQRQSPDLEAYKKRYAKNFGMSQAAVEEHVARLIHGSTVLAPANRPAVAALARELRLPLASHDDATAAQVAESQELGCVLAEFPTTLEAATAARGVGQHVLMGAPNLLRGGSHSGNVRAADLAAAGLLDVLSSDYIPAALLPAALALAEPPFAFGLPAAIATVTANPAAAAGLADRGRIEPGLRADLVRVAMVQGRPLVRGVWVAGERVA